MKKCIAIFVLVVASILQVSAMTRLKEPHSSTSEIEYAVECIQRICPTVIWDSWTFRDIIYDKESKNVLMIIQIKYWREKNNTQEVTQADIQKETEWIVANFKEAYQDLITSSESFCDGDWMLYLSVGQLLKTMVKEDTNLRIMLLKPDYMNQVSSEIPFELSAEQVKNVKAR